MPVMDFKEPLQRFNGERALLLGLEGFRRRGTRSSARLGRRDRLKVRPRCATARRRSHAISSAALSASAAAAAVATA